MGKVKTILTLSLYYLHGLGPRSNTSLPLPIPLPAFLGAPDSPVVLA